MSRDNRSHVIIAVTAVILCALVIIGVVVGVHMFTHSTNKMVEKTYEFHVENSKKQKEDVGVSLEDNFVQYHTYDEDSEIWTINDFNRDLTVTKVKEAEGTICFVSPLNRSANEAEPGAVMDSDESEQLEEQEDEDYEMLEQPIKDHSVLGAPGQKLCRGFDVHWLVQSCDEPLEMPLEDNREKRVHKSMGRHPCFVRRIIIQHYWYCNKRKRCGWRRRHKRIRRRCKDTRWKTGG